MNEKRSEVRRTDKFEEVERQEKETKTITSSISCYAQSIIQEDENKTPREVVKKDQRGVE